MKMPFMQTFAWKIAEFFHVCRTASSKLNTVLIFCYTILTQYLHKTSIGFTQYVETL